MQVVITPAGKEFITPVTLSALSGKPVVSEFFTANTGEWHSHVDLGLWADLLVVAPATASTIAKMATGVADNMLITTYLSAKEPVMVAPAMDLDMYAHPTTVRNLATLKRDGVMVLDAPSGELASGLTGKGRMPEPETIFQEIEKFFASKTTRSSLKGKKVLITAGPTHEKIDPVRFLGNHSSGKMGFAIAEEMAGRGAEVTVVCGPVCNVPPTHPNVKIVPVVSALDMLEEVTGLYPECDVAVFAAAVADYRPEKPEDSKIKREKRGEMQLRLVANPDISLEMGKQKKACQLNVGFALETDNGIENALGKLKRKNLDLIVLNPAGDPSVGFNSDSNKITLLSSSGEAQDLPVMLKKDCAVAIADKIEAMTGIGNQNSED